MQKHTFLKGLITSLALFLSLTGIAFAHAVVTPAQSVTAKNELYSLSVPTEKDIPTIGVRLVVPPELDSITPLVKPGWYITLTKNKDGKVVEVKWTGGNIPAGLKDLFQFSARASTASTLNWKVYQTYSDGGVVSWDQDPNGKPMDMGTSTPAKVENPYSQTQIASTAPSTAPAPVSNLPLVLSIGAIVISLIAVFISFKTEHEH